MRSNECEQRLGNVIRRVMEIRLENAGNRILHTVGPLTIESLWAKKRVSTGALRALDDPLVVQTKI